MKHLIPHYQRRENQSAIRDTYSDKMSPLRDYIFCFFHLISAIPFCPEQFGSPQRPKRGIHIYHTAPSGAHWMPSAIRVATAVCRGSLPTTLFAQFGRPGKDCAHPPAAMSADALCPREKTWQPPRQSIVRQHTTTNRQKNPD